MENQTLQQEYRTLKLIWFVLLFSQAMFLIVLFTAKPEVFRFDSAAPFLSGENSIFVAVFASLAITNLALSFIIKKRCLQPAAEKQETQYVRLGLIIGCAFCESISVMGMILAFAFSYQYFFLWFLLGIIGIVLHFPKRTDLMAASYKK